MPSILTRTPGRPVRQGMGHQIGMGDPPSAGPHQGVELAVGVDPADAWTQESMMAVLPDANFPLQRDELRAGHRALGLQSTSTVILRRFRLNGLTIHPPLHPRSRLSQVGAIAPQYARHTCESLGASSMCAAQQFRAYFLGTNRDACRECISIHAGCSDF